MELKKGLDSPEKVVGRIEELMGDVEYEEGKVAVCCNDDIVQNPSGYSSTRELIPMLDEYHDTSVVLVGDYMEDGFVGKTYRPIEKNGEVRFVEYETEPIELECDVLFVRGMNYHASPSEEEFKKQMKMLGDFDVGRYINTPEAQSFLESKDNYSENLENVPIPETYNFEDIYDLMEVLEEEGNLVGKPPIGGQGTGVLKLDKDQANEKYLQECFEGSIDDFTFQKLVKQEEKERERRFVFLNDEYDVYDNQIDGDYEIVASREIINRDRPWDPDGKVLDKIRRLHEPEEDEIEIVNTVIEQTPPGTIFGCVDMLVDDDDNKFVIEMNGSGTGLFGDSKEAGTKEWGERYYNLTPHMVNYVCRLVGD